MENLKNGKASVDDCVETEIIKYGWKMVVKGLIKLCNNIWTMGRVSHYISTATIEATCNINDL